MKTFEANGQKFYEGCIWKDKDGDYRKVLSIGEYLGCSYYCGSMEEADIEKRVGNNWFKDELEDANAKVVAFKKCGPDKNGKVVRQWDWVDSYGCKNQVLGFVDSFNGDGEDCFILKDDTSVGGWVAAGKKCCTLIEPEKPEDPILGSEVEVKVKGKTYKAKVVGESER